MQKIPFTTINRESVPMMILSMLSMITFSSVYGLDSVWTEWWWTYDGFSGPAWWGTKWPICNAGKYQSPIDILPDKLLFDPNLTGVVFSSEKKINGNLTNTGNDITLFVDDVIVPLINATSGPLQYVYHLHHIKLHFGHDEASGSEHTVNGQAFPAEIQLYMFNADLYANYTQAMSSPNGLVAFSIFLEVGKIANEAYTMISNALTNIPTKVQLKADGERKNCLLEALTNACGNALKELKVSNIACMVFPCRSYSPQTKEYITYEGSLTQPQCQETVTWVIFNKPIYIVEQQLTQLRNVNKEGGSHLLIFGNIRPSQPLYNRLVRTNINFRHKTKLCSMVKEVFYKVNTVQPRSGR